MGGTDIVCRLHHLVNENYQQELGCHSSGWWRNRWWNDCRSCCTFLDLRQTSESAVRDCCLRKMMTSWIRGNRSWASDGSPPAPAQILGPWPWRLPFSWRVTWKSDCCYFQEARRSSKSCLTRFTDLFDKIYWVGRRAARGIPERISRWDWENF